MYPSLPFKSPLPPPPPSQLDSLLPISLRTLKYIHVCSASRHVASLLSLLGPLYPVPPGALGVQRLPCSTPCLPLSRLSYKRAVALSFPLPPSFSASFPPETPPNSPESNLLYPGMFQVPPEPHGQCPEEPVLPDTRSPTSLLSFST